MLAITHLVVTVLLIQLMTLDKNDSFVALLFGVFIDVDHLLGLKGYIEVHGVAGVLDTDSLMQADGQWKSILHNPMAVMVVGTVSAASRIAVPLIFWSVHISMDWLEDTFLGVFSITEFSILAVCFTALVGIRYSRSGFAHPGWTFGEYLKGELAGLSSFFRSLRPGASG